MEEKQAIQFMAGVHRNSQLTQAREKIIANQLLITIIH